MVRGEIWGSGADLEDTETGNLNLVALGQGLGDGLESSGNNLLGVLLGQASLSCNSSDEFSFSHF